MPLGMALLSIFIIGVHLAPRDAGGEFDIKQFSTLPVNYEGRIQPLDSLARNAMKIMRGREGTTIADLLAERAPLYEAHADLTVDASRGKPEALAARILAQLPERSA